MVEGKISLPPPTYRHSSTDCQKICHRWLWWPPYSCAKFAENCPQVVCANGWKYNKILYIFLFIDSLETPLQVTSLNDFCVWWLKRCGTTQGCDFWGHVHWCTRHLRAHGCTRHLLTTREHWRCSRAMNTGSVRTHDSRDPWLTSYSYYLSSAHLLYQQPTHSYT